MAKIDKICTCKYDSKRLDDPSKHQAYFALRDARLFSLDGSSTARGKTNGNTPQNTLGH